MTLRKPKKTTGPSGSGWHLETVRHSNARKLGHAGGNYHTKEYEVTLKGNTEESEYGTAGNPPIVISAENKVAAKKQLELPKGVSVDEIKEVGSAKKSKAKKSVSLESLYDKEKHRAVYSKKNAMNIQNKLKSSVGDKVILSGGGGFGDIYKAKLKEIRTEKVTYYGENNKTYTKPDDYKIVAVLDFGSDKKGPFGNRIFEPNLGSWKIEPLPKQKFNFVKSKEGYTASEIKILRFIAKKKTVDYTEVEKKFGKNSEEAILSLFSKSVLFEPKMGQVSVLASNDYLKKIGALRMSSYEKKRWQKYSKSRDESRQARRLRLSGEPPWKGDLPGSNV